MPVKYKGIFKTLFRIYTRCQQTDFFNALTGSSCEKYNSNGNATRALF